MGRVVESMRSNCLLRGYAGAESRPNALPIPHELTRLKPKFIKVPFPGLVLPFGHHGSQ